ncbi:MAG TPA: helix-turn-helix domain-containing protein [Planctomycetaceae bacterium]|nr:helix-turn-helix domain-containing protein [Planctomycetaceae bacterium]
MATPKKTRRPLFERLKQGLEEGIAFSRGELSLRTVEIPEEPPQVDRETLAAIRERAQMSQAVFARVLNVSPKTVQSWEQGVRKPSHASLRLIEIFSQRPGVVCDLVGLKRLGAKHGLAQGFAKTVHIGGRRKLVAQKQKTHK